MLSLDLESVNGLVEAASTKGLDRNAFDNVLSRLACQ